MSIGVDVAVAFGTTVAVGTGVSVSLGLRVAVAFGMAVGDGVGISERELHLIFMTSALSFESVRAHLFVLIVAVWPAARYCRLTGRFSSRRLISPLHVTTARTLEKDFIRSLQDDGCIETVSFSFNVRVVRLVSAVTDDVLRIRIVR